MLLVAQPKSGSTSLLKTLAKILKISFKNGLGKQIGWEYCKGFQEIQKYHDTTIKRSLDFFKKWITTRKVLYKEHILPTKEHLEYIKKINCKITIVLRNPKDSLDNYKRMYDKYKNGNMERDEINELMPYRFDNIDFDKYLNDLIEFNKKWREFNYNKKLIITFEDLILDYNNTIKKILTFWGIRIPDKIIPLIKSKGNHGYNTYTGVGEKRLLKQLQNKNAIKMAKEKWEKSPPGWSHLIPTKHHISEENMINRFKRLLKDIELNNKIIIDYGCGGGYLGRYLLENHDIKKYIAFDIALRSIKRTKEQLDKYEKTEIILIENHDIKFKKYNPDIFCSFACIIHFPTQIYLNTFLNNVNESNAEYLILEIRNTGKGTIFRKNPYKTSKDQVLACITEPGYIEEKLNNYKLFYASDPKEKSTDCQLIYFRKINKDSNDTL